MLCPYGTVALITGASSGIGQATARLLAQEGFHVYGTSRKGGTRTDYAKGFIEMLPMDVTDDDSVAAGVAAVVKAEGHIDILVNGAGIGIGGAVEDCKASDAHRQMDTNYYGVIRLLNAVLPHMRAQRRGIVVNIGSVGGIYSIPFQTLYSSSKCAVEALTEGLRMELHEFGVRATLVEPGDTKTGFTASRMYASGCENTAYLSSMGRAIGKMIQDETNGVDPMNVARVIRSLIYSKNPPVRKVVGFGYKAMVFCKRILPARTVVFMLRKMYVQAKEPTKEVWSSLHITQTK